MRLAGVQAREPDQVRKQLPRGPYFSSRRESDSPVGVEVVIETEGVELLLVVDDEEEEVPLLREP